ncbi:hypothetical protein CCACVL1_28435 [Corchorus capsularis]|uniref:Cullin N-terminal domain-containing protein n=1 Tax=Corchorus capsularis TaxID=210143 RepID=A0A1R3G6I5_COCAP|nr:hypothetical protein CCACVL1_28435 [Corchorus capsularis]
MFNAREDAAFKMPHFLPDCSPSFALWWAGQWKNITDNENVEVIAARLAPPGGKRIAKPKKPKRAASDPSSDNDEENEAPSLVARKKNKPTSLNASATPASSHPTTDCHPTQPKKEAEKPKATKPSILLAKTPSSIVSSTSSKPAFASKPASFTLKADPTSVLLARHESLKHLLSKVVPSPYLSFRDSEIPSEAALKDALEEQRSKFEIWQQDIEDENSKVFDPTEEEFEVDRKITDLEAELASLKARRANLAAKREQTTLERINRLEARAKELIARQPEIEEINRQHDYLQFQMVQLSTDFESWIDYLPGRKEYGDDGEKGSRMKARSMVVAAMQAVSSLRKGGKGIERIEDAIDFVNNQLSVDDLSLPAPRSSIPIDSIRSTIFEEMNNQIRDAVMSMINSEREGKNIDQALVKNVQSIYVDVGQGSMKYYDKDFEEALFKDTAAFYHYDGMANSHIRRYRTLLTIIMERKLAKRQRLSSPTPPITPTLPTRPTRPTATTRLTPKTLALAAELAASSPDADSAADFAQIDDSIRLSLLLMDELIQQSIRRRAVFEEPNYPKVISLLVAEADRSEFHKKRIGWWIQNDNLPEESLKMIVHLKCDCGAEGCVTCIMMESLSVNRVSSCGIAREAVADKKMEESTRKFLPSAAWSIQTRKFLPPAASILTDFDADHPAFKFTASDLYMFQDSDDDYVNDVYAIWLLEHELEHSIQYPNCSNPREVFQEPSYPNVISLFGGEPGEPVRSVFDEKKDLPKDDLKMVVHLKCYCGVEGCVYWYNDGGLSWSKVTLSAVRSRMCAYFATCCSCGSHVTHCGIVTEASAVDPAASIPTTWSASYAGLPAFNFKATDLALLNDFDIFNVILLLEGVYDPSEYDKITDVPNPKAVFCEPGYPRVITLGEDAPARSEFHNETIGWWIQKSELAEDIKMIVHLKCNCGAKGSVTWFNDGNFKLSQGDKLSVILSRKVAYLGTSCMCGSDKTHCGIAFHKSIDKILGLGKKKRKKDKILGL